MEFFVKVVFWLYLAEVVLKLVNITTGEYEKPKSLNLHAADTIFIAILAIWAGFVIWYQ